MKKYIATFLMMAMMAVMVPLMASSADAQTRRSYNKPSVYKKHRNLINIGIGTGAGALLGALIGGKKGAAIGALAGGGGSALYTYKLNPKTKRYNRVRRY
ncbi:MAG: hypothetical protein ACR2IA_05415 [Pyrinomonadaceae bacterium]